MCMSYEEKEEYGPFLYNAMGILDNRLIQNEHLKIK